VPVVWLGMHAGMRVWAFQIRGGIVGLAVSVGASLYVCRRGEGGSSVVSSSG
jgi:hypothetical protein